VVVELTIKLFKKYKVESNEYKLQSGLPKKTERMLSIIVQGPGRPTRFSNELKNVARPRNAAQAESGRGATTFCASPIFWIAEILAA